MTLRTPRSTLFPYTTLFRSIRVQQTACAAQPPFRVAANQLRTHELRARFEQPGEIERLNAHYDVERDRKSTRLNSSHTVISYAVFCLKKKKIDAVGINLN